MIILSLQFVLLIKMHKLNFINNMCEKNNIDYINNFKIEKKSWLKAGGIINNFILPKNKSELKTVIEFFVNEKQKFLVIGNFSNVIMRDGVITTPVINFNLMNELKHKFEGGNLLIEADAGVSIPRISKHVIKLGYTGMEGLLGIPGSIGGGIFMNASSYGSSLSEFLIKVEVMDMSGKVKIFSKNEIKFSWRKSIFQSNKLIILKSYFKIQEKNYKGTSYTQQKAKEIFTHRAKFQENDLPNLGSLFATKNIYKDLSKVSFIFYIMYLLNKIFSFIFFNFAKKYIYNYRRIMIKFYSKLLGLNKFQNFGVSDKTLNCLVNNGSSKANEAIKLIKFLEKKINYKILLENVIIENIE